MAHILPPIKLQFFDSSGDPLAGGKIWSYQAGTSTPLATYTDKGGLTANANPVILDANGEASIWLSSAAYKFVIMNSLDVTLRTVDNVSVTNAGSIIETMFGDGVVSTRALAALSVTEAKIAAGAITVTKLGAGSVTYEKIDEFAKLTLFRRFAYLNWIYNTPPSDQNWGGIAFGGGIFVAIAGEEDANNFSIARSIDGQLWTMSAAASDESWNAIAFGIYNGVDTFVAVSAFPSVTDSTQYSTNGGFSWTAVNSAEANSWRAIAFGDGSFVAVSSDGTNRVMRSTDDGVTWTAISVAASAWQDITYGGGVYVAVASDGNIMRSTDDGLTWTAQGANSNQLSGLAYGNGVFVVGNAADAGGLVSFDLGLTWIAVPGLGATQGLAYGNGRFVGVTLGQFATSLMAQE